MGDSGACATSRSRLAFLAVSSAWRLLLVLTYRPSDFLRSQHHFGPVKLDLQARGVCREIALPFLSRVDFDHYLALAFEGHHFPEELAAVLHARTEGNPLFMVDLLRYLRERGDTNIKSNADLINKATFYNDPNFPERGIVTLTLDGGK